jgi:hypothetical protein
MSSNKIMFQTTLVGMSRMFTAPFMFHFMQTTGSAALRQMNMV